MVNGQIRKPTDKKYMGYFEDKLCPNGQWSRIKIRQWSMVNGQWSMVNGQIRKPTYKKYMGYFEDKLCPNGQWSWVKVSGQCSMVNGQGSRSVVNGQWSMVNGQWSSLFVFYLV